MGRKLFETRRGRERRLEEARPAAEEKRYEMEIIARREKSQPFFNEVPASQRIAEMKRMADYIIANGSSSDRSLTIGKSLAFPQLMQSRDPAAKSFFEEIQAIYSRLTTEATAEAQTIRLGAEGREISGVWYALGTVGLLAGVTAWRNR
jgi:hypothetical protein